MNQPKNKQAFVHSWIVYSAYLDKFSELTQESQQPLLKIFHEIFLKRINPSFTRRLRTSKSNKNNNTTLSTTISLSEENRLNGRSKTSTWENNFEIVRNQIEELSKLSPFSQAQTKTTITNPTAGPQLKDQLVEVGQAFGQSAIKIEDMPRYDPFKLNQGQVGNKNQKNLDPWTPSTTKRRKRRWKNSSSSSKKT